MIARITLVSFGLLGASAALAGPAPKVDVCHQSSAGVFHVININQNAASAHLTNHGDSYPAQWWPDSDGDGFGDPDAATDRCPQAGLVNNGDDCAPTDAAVNPGATEVPYDGVDNDCSSESLDDDLDRDGYLLADDCNDQDAAVNPGELELPYDGVDNDCDASTPDDDLDADGFLIADDCNDENEAINPSATEACGDSMDNNCDGTIDEGCVVNECPCFTSELILAQWDAFQASQWQYSWAACQEVSVDYDDGYYYYYYDYDYTQIYWGGQNYDGYSNEGTQDYFYSIDYDDYYEQTFCHGNSYEWDYDYANGYYTSSSDFYAFQYLTEEQHASCEALLRETSALMGLSCSQYTYP